ncbi:uncharacterized protein LODBEIA_P28340 [Lodderomyces beijingensis]|uniref:Carbohydrate kinase PfkB domain-containing protein n=1 Tax=Lodderomyces beijingensis TaxID=1775926 RepID=A0ABP0ZQY0_9ASCO
MILTTLGMFIIDSNEYISPPKPPETDIIGGAGTYAIIGARIISPTPAISSQISGIIDKGTDFPPRIQHEIESWQTGIHFRANLNRKTTRGINTYRDGIRSFRYATPKLRVEVEDISRYGLDVSSRCFHLICSIARCHSIITEIQRVNPDAVFVYEPLPDDCLVENYPHLKSVLSKVDVFTPNLDEARSLVGDHEAQLSLSELSSKFTQHQKLDRSATVIRCGAAGCHVETTNLSRSFPAYHQDQSRVVDVTGGGNSFCGGFIMGWYLSGGDWMRAAVCGNISSGCIIEKLGVPLVQGDKYNGLTLEERLDIYYNANPELR